MVQLPPFEVVGGTHAADLTAPGKRFFQYDYRLRLFSEDLFGGNMPVPPLEIAYHESQVAGGESAQGREQSYSLPPASIRLISVVPDTTSDIRDGGGVWRASRIATRAPTCCRPSRPCCSA